MSGDKGAVLNLDVARKACIVHHNNIVAEPAIVRPVCIGHQEGMGPDDRGPVLFGTAVNGHILTDAALIADAQERALTAVFEVLGGAPQRRADPEVAVPTDGRPAVNDGVRTDVCSVAGTDVFADHSIGADVDILPEFGLRMDGRGGMNAHVCSAISIACSSASAASLPFTVVVPTK